MSTLKNLHRQARRTSRPAFTLLELIVVLLVLGILAAIAVPTFAKVKENAVTRVTQSTLETLDRDGEAIAVSDYSLSDSQIAAAVVAEMTPRAGMTITRDGAEITVEYDNASAVAQGSVTFANGVGTIVPAAVSGGGGALAYSIGDIGPGGGRVFITPATAGNSTGLYFEAAPFAAEATATWCGSSTSNMLDTLVGASGTAIGSGASNTATADAACVTDSGAIQIAADYSNNGFSDWFLPSQDELNELYLNKNSLGGFSEASYWSSSEDLVQPDGAFLQMLTDGFQYGHWFGTGKFDPHVVRPVRSFSA